MTKQSRNIWPSLDCFANARNDDKKKGRSMRPFLNLLQIQQQSLWIFNGILDPHEEANSLTAINNAVII